MDIFMEAMGRKYYRTRWSGCMCMTCDFFFCYADLSVERLAYAFALGRI